jgi:hypothetical protein
MRPVMYAFPLALTATIYGRQGQVLAAEGLLRKAAKVLKLESIHTAWMADKTQQIELHWQANKLAKQKGPPSSCLPLPPPLSGDSGHRSAGALVAWRLGQILTPIPLRDKEARAWGDLGRVLWPFSNAIDNGGACMEEQLGGRRMFQPDGKKGAQFMVSNFLGSLVCAGDRVQRRPVN